MKRTSGIPRSRVLPALAMVALALAAFSAFAQSDEILTLDIEPQNADAALLQLGRTSGMQIMLAEGTGAETEVKGLKGEYRFEEALAALLTDSGLTYEYAAGNVVLVQEEEPDRETEDEAVDESAAGEEEEPLELESQTVTGSRLVRGDPTSRVITFTAEDIAARGVSNLEELFRTLPWHYPSINSQTTGHQQVTVSRDSGDRPLSEMDIGYSTINLRGLGSRNTLVLVDGRRVAGVAGEEDDFANLVNVPLSAIERVEIQLDGGSAVYGSDAIGGLVNFITKKDYRGLSATYRQEFSSTDSHRRNFDLHAGYAWGTGSVTGILARDRSKPISNRKIYTSMDFREQFGPEYDLRSLEIGQPGVVCNYNGSLRFPGCTWEGYGVFRRLPEDHSGVGATPEDFIPFLDRWPWVTDFVYPANGEDSTHDSLTLRVEQYITDNLRVYAEALISDSYSYRHQNTRFIDFVVPASNAYNPYNENVVVSYLPIRELESGLIPHGYAEADNQQRNYNVGFFWQFRGHELEFNMTRSESERVARNLRADYRRNIWDPSAEKFYEALASSDPNVALNLFGNGTAQSPGFADLFTHPFGRSVGVTTVTTYEPVARGELFRIWGGPVTYAVGGEYRKHAYEENQQRYEYGEYVHWYGKEIGTGLQRPEQSNNAYFGEFAFPIVGPDNARRGLHSLILSFQMRRDTYKTFGGTGGLFYERQPAVRHLYAPGEGWTTEEYRSWVTSGTVVQGEDSKSETSKRVGLQYKPNENLVMRASWSGSFKPPGIDRRFHPYGDELLWHGNYVDPYHPDGLTESRRYPIFQLGHLPLLRPEIGDTYSLSFDWSPEAVPGLQWYVSWSRVDYKDQIRGSSLIRRVFPEIAFAMPEIAERDENGYITRIISGSVNIAKDVHEMVGTQFEYAFATRLGRFTPGLSYTRILEEYFQFTPESERVSVLGTALGANRYRIMASLNWQWRRFEADLFAHYIPSYTSDSGGRCYRLVGKCERYWQDLPLVEAKPLTTVDLTVTYRFDNGLRLRAGGRNILNAKPHVLWYRLPYDATRWDARGRVFFLEANWEM